mmetsp:Transcript_16933/g.19468  ORF Transcript_16933/g.19468 Transcript_16933/m.19468 type:complete len:260 (+) Transcript_16933:68-847(+)|eukprot:CAMPEP_0170942962 /NCGR_PEP_ID=MMETSP0735-20130129/24582_1 /TAXON_ID=186038 /ORGANISM="Fragilariopsis kerguelensis, Strain L26-C5" /LENGTH=259 /DNA_ID=CAMNT_0011350115 /DNA_START=28 /DNA_END=807 /DNA_ORIENTATION=-
MVNKKKMRKEKKAALKMAASSQPPTCYHGSTAEAFQKNSRYRVALEEYWLYNQDHIAKRANFTDKESGEFVEQQLKAYIQKYKDLLQDPDFCCFIFAYSAKVLLARGMMTGEFYSDKLLFLPCLGIKTRYNLLPESEGKHVGPGSNEKYYEKFCKYTRDIMTERGQINVLAREVPCDCLKGLQKQAKTMEKVAYCAGCHGQFPKETMFLCTGCKISKYCSANCQASHWPLHKIDCRLKGKHFDTDVDPDRYKLDSWLEH